MEEPLLLQDRDDRGVVTLTLNRPKAFNAMSEAMLAALGRMRDDAVRGPTVPGRAVLADAQVAVEQHMGCAMGVCRACVIVTKPGNARVCREGPVFALGDVLFEQGEPATVGVR